MNLFCLHTHLNGSALNSWWLPVWFQIVCECGITRMWKSLATSLLFTSSFLFTYQGLILMVWHRTVGDLRMISGCLWMRHLISHMWKSHSTSLLFTSRFRFTLPKHGSLFIPWYSEVLNSSWRYPYEGEVGIAFTSRYHDNRDNQRLYSLWFVNLMWALETLNSPERDINLETILRVHTFA